MDLQTIKSKLNAVESTGYRHYQDVEADLHLMLANALFYNDRVGGVNARRRNGVCALETEKYKGGGREGRNRDKCHSY